MSKPYVVLDAGHGGSDSGATNEIHDQDGYADIIYEKNINLNVALYCRRHMIEYTDSIVPILTRKRDKFIPLQGRCDRAKECYANSFVSIHCNSFGDDSVTGYEVFYWWNGAEKLARITHKWLGLSLPTHKDRGVKHKNYYVIGENRKTGKPNGIKNAVLVELEFLSNDAMAEWLDRDNVQRTLGITISDALREYYLC